MVCSGSTFYFPDITVHQPSVTITASPTRVKSGDSSTIAWTSYDTTGCTITKNGQSWKSGTSGNVADSALTAQTTYVATCHTTAGSTVTSTVVVNVDPQFNEF
jgi:hypothetical protein